jgi:hypothetical protein
MSQWGSAKARQVLAASPISDQYPSENYKYDTIGFQFGNEDFFILARKSRDCAFKRPKVARTNNPAD